VVPTFTFHTAISITQSESASACCCCGAPSASAFYRAAPGERPLLSYYANAIAPLLDGPAVSAASGKTD
jgi:hypothetical protein